MDDDELLDLLTSVEETVRLDDKPAAFEDLARGLQVGEYGRASLLIAAGEHWQMREQYDEARRCYEEARADGGESRSDPVANLLSLALAASDEEAARAYDAELRALARQDQVSSSTCHLIGESYELHGNLRAALRWMSIPFTHADPYDEAFDQLLLVARRRVRAQLGMAPDRLDSMVEERPGS